MAKNTDALLRAASELETEGLGETRSESRFVDAILKVMPDSAGTQDKARRVASGLETILARHHDDSRRIIASSLALGEASEYELPQFIKKLSRFLRFLDTPVAAHSLKNIKLTGFVSQNPELLRIKHVDSLSTLGRLPEGSITMGSSKDEIWVGDVAVRLDKDEPKKINQAVKKLKAETAPRPKPQMIDEMDNRPGASLAPLDEDERQGAEAEPLAMEALDGPTHERENDLPEELSQAERALSKVLGRLNDDLGHSELSQALAQARRLLLQALQQDAQGLEAASW